jgi:hypothetical protein
VLANLSAAWRLLCEMGDGESLNNIAVWNYGSEVTQLLFYL